MANSRFEYVKQYEQDDSLLKNCWLVVRIDGHNFHAFAEAHKFEKPNDIRALELMNYCAKEVMKQCGEIVIAIGESDEYSFVLKRDTTLYSRRSSKIATFIASTFSAHYVFHWSRFFPKTPMQYPACFDGRVVCYPSNKNVRDYLSWRQADCHINNLYNTCFWNLVLKSNLTNKEAEAKLAGTGSDFKNELLFNDFKINYNQLPAMFRRGSILIWTEVSPDDGEGEGERSEGEDKEGTETTGKRVKRQISVLHEDLINQDFYERYPGIIPYLSRGQIKKMKKKALKPGTKDTESDGGTRTTHTTLVASVTAVTTTATGRTGDGKRKSADVQISIDRVVRDEPMFTPIRTTTPGGPTTIGPTAVGPMPKDSPYHPIASTSIESWGRSVSTESTPYAMMTTGAFQSSSAGVVVCEECRKSGLITSQCVCKTTTPGADPSWRTGEMISDTNYSRVGGSGFASKVGLDGYDDGGEVPRRPSFQAALEAAVGARAGAVGRGGRGETATTTTTGGGAGGGAGGAGDPVGAYGPFGASAFGRELSTPTATPTPTSTPSLSRQSSDIDIDIEKKAYYINGTRLAAEELLRGKPHGTFLFRLCNDKKEFIDNKPNPNLFVLCYSRPPKKMVNIKVWRYPGSGLGQKKDPAQCVVYPTVAMLLHALVDQPQSPIAEPT